MRHGVLIRTGRTDWRSAGESPAGRANRLLLALVVLIFSLAGGSLPAGAAPFITAITPGTGLTTGGATVVLQGTGFTGTTAVLYGTTPAAFTVNSDSQLTTTSPPGAVGPVSISVVTPSGTQTISGAFVYSLPLPVVTGITPAGGPLGGGGTATITGTQLGNVTSVRIGGVLATNLVVQSATQLQVTVPAGLAGLKSVVAYNLSGSSNSYQGYTYYDVPTITGASPLSISTAGGQVITLTGTNFIAPVSLSVNGAPVAVTLVSSTQVKFTAPPAAAGAALLTLTAAGGTVTNNTVFTYVGTPTVTSVAPNAGTRNGGTSVTITGTNFGSVSGVTFGGVNAQSYTVMSPTKITATTPPGTLGDVNVAVANTLGSGQLANGFQYQPTIASVAPGTGVPGGATTVTITGTGFTGATAVRFGTANAFTFTVNSDTQITAVSPPGTLGNIVDISVFNSGVTGTKAQAFTYANGPTIASVTPSTGYTTGGTTIVIAGTDFTGTTSVTVGGTAVTSFTVNSSTKITATTPARAIGTYYVSVQTGAGTAVKASAFTYTQVPPAPTAVTPANGPFTGGTSVTITGTNFLNVTAVKFGAVDAQAFTVVNATTITATAPPGTAGPVTIAVTGAAGTGSLANGFTYNGTPTVTSLTPSSGPIGGGTVVAITGTDFVGVTGVKIGGVNATGFTVVSATRINATVPAGAAGPADVSVTSALGTGVKTGGFVYIGPPTVASVTPAGGPFGGGTAVQITGTDFTGATALRFGNNNATIFTVNTASLITALVPPGTAGPVAVSVTTPSGTGSKAGGYTYMGAPTVNAVTPSSGPFGGGTTITITGADFLGASDVKIGGVSATAINVVSANQLTAVTPPGTPGPADVSVTTASGTTTLNGGFTYIAAPTITGISPASGPFTGGTSVQIAGTDLAGATAVTFGGVNAISFTVDSANQITAVVPSGMSGPVAVAVTTPSGTATKAAGFTYIGPPVIAAITPASGPYLGGTSVQISGADLSGASAVTFGGVNATSFTVNSANQITAVAPPGTAGPVAVAVTTALGTETRAAGFTYIGAPTIAAVTPASGPFGGGTTITIDGTDFIGVTGVTVGGVAAANVTVVSPTKLTVETPAGTPGPADVSVTTASGTATLTGGFTYIPAPSVIAITPASGPIGGGTTITLLGANFIGVTDVKVGGVAATNVTVVSPTKLTAVTPAGTAGHLDVTVTTASGTGTLAGAFTYIPAPSIFVVTPSSGPFGGGTTITIDGANFVGVTGVKIGGVAATGVTAVNASTLKAVTPAGVPGPADVTVTTASGTAMLAGGFTFIGAPTITSITPASGPFGGGTTITIDGTNFLGITGVTVGGAAASNVTVISATKLTAVTPAGTPGQADVSVSTASGTATAPGLFTYIAAPTITGITPASGPFGGGTTITIDGSDFNGVSGVTIGGIAAANVTVLSATKLTAVTPPGLPGPADVSVTTASGTATLTGGFTRIGPPAIVSVTPSLGPVGGGTPVQIDGSDLAGATAVKFGGVDAATFTVVSASRIDAVVPPGAAGPVAVSVTTPIGTGAKTAGFTYVGAPTITGIAPASGPLGGGTTITVQGTDFIGVTGVEVAGVAATSVTVLSATKLTAVTPAGAPGPADVAVTTVPGTATLTGGFTYVAAPSIVSVTPSSGPVGGGTVVQIAGADFGGATAVTFGGVNASGFTVDSASEISAVVPPGTAGAVAVAVTTPSGTATKANGFVYVAPPPPATITVTPAASALPDAYLNEDYQVQFSAGGGAGPYAFSLAGGALPAGLSLDGATGLLSGKPNGQPGTYSLTLSVRDAAGITAQASYTVALKARLVSVADRDIAVEAGFPPPDVSLDEGATGGPFGGAAIVYVDPPAAGAASIVPGTQADVADPLPGGFYLRFRPEPDFVGTVRVGYRLTGNGGQSDTGVVTYRIGTSRSVAVRDIRSRESRFVTQRQALLSEAISLPGLAERRATRSAEEALRQAFAPSADGAKLNLSYGRQIDGKGQGYIWTNAVFMLRQGPADADTGALGSWSSFSLASAGVDHLFGERMLAGLSLHVHDDRAAVEEGISIRGRGWLAGPYASIDLGRNTMLDLSLLYGQSSNEIRSNAYRGSFDTSLWMLRGSLHGEIALKDGSLFLPRLKITYLGEDVADHAVFNGSGQRLEIPGFAEQQLRGSIGFDLTRQIAILGEIVVTPSLGLDIGYAALDGDGLYVTVKPGLSVVTAGGWNLLGGVQMSFAAEGELVFGVTASATKTF